MSATNNLSRCVNFVEMFEQVSVPSESNRNFGRDGRIELDNLLKRVELMEDAWRALCFALDSLTFSGNVDGLGRVADARLMWPGGSDEQNG